MTPKRIKEIINMIPKECNPRLGGSYNLYLRGLKDSYRDIDIIIAKGTLDKVQLPYPKIELVHKGLNKRTKYCIDGREVDILESLFEEYPLEESLLGIKFESVDRIDLSRITIDTYLYLTNTTNTCKKN